LKRGAQLGAARYFRFDSSPRPGLEGSEVAPPFGVGGAAINWPLLKLRN
jgi:hypothetical protein